MSVVRLKHFLHCDAQMVKSLPIHPFGHTYSLLDCNPGFVQFLTYNSPPKFSTVRRHVNPLFNLVEMPGRRVNIKKIRPLALGIGPIMVSEREKAIHPPRGTHQWKISGNKSINASPHPIAPTRTQPMVSDTGVGRTASASYS